MARSSDEIIAELPEADRILIAEKIAVLDRKLEQLRKQDAAIVAGLARSLAAPTSAAERIAVRAIEKFIRDLIRQETKS